MRLVTVALAAAGLLLTGCTAPVAQPIEPSDDEAQSFAQVMLDGTHEYLDIPGNPSTSATGLMDYDTWITSMEACLGDAGVTNTSVGWTDSAFELYTYDGAKADPAQNAALYECLTMYPLDMRTIGRLYTESQREYVWDYYQRWVIPCLAEWHIQVQFAPSYEEFASETLYLWSPYDGVDYETLFARLTYFDRTDPYSALEDLCGPRYGAVAP